MKLFWSLLILTESKAPKYGKWSSWSPCTETCGKTSTTTRSRECPVQGACKGNRGNRIKNFYATKYHPYDKANRQKLKSVKYQCVQARFPKTDQKEIL